MTHNKEKEKYIHSQPLETVKKNNCKYQKWKSINDFFALLSQLILPL